MYHFDLDSEMESVVIVRKVKCPRDECGNVWETKSQKILVSCPKCTYKLEIKKCLVK